MINKYDIETHLSLPQKVINANANKKVDKGVHININHLLILHCCLNEA